MAKKSKKKKNKTGLILFLIILVVVVLVVGYLYINRPAAVWAYNETEHWKQTTFGAVQVESERGEHTFSAWEVRVQPTSSSEGKQRKECVVCGYAVEETLPKTGGSSPISETSGDVLSRGIYAGDYYREISSSDYSNAGTLKSKLNQLLNENYRRYSYAADSTELKTVDSYDGYYVECIYTGVRLEKGDAWDKEHVWAKSYGFKDESYDAYSDMHHLRVSEHSINVNRSSSYFAEVTSPTASDEYGNKWTSTAFEPRDEVKGDIARMLFYMTVKYDEASILDLELTSDIAKIDASASVFGGVKPTGKTEQEQTELDKRTYVAGDVYLGSLETLLKWHYADPVDAREISRNEAIYSLQNNRNPFIDHPEFVAYLYPEESAPYLVSESAIEELSSVYVNYNAEALASLQSKILSLGEITLESKTALDEIQNEYSALGEVTKSFVKEYHTFVEAKAAYDKLFSSANQKTDEDTTLSFVGINNKAGTLFENGITLSFEGVGFHTNYGVYAQVDKNGNHSNATLTASGVYSTVKSLVFTWSNNKETGKASVIVNGVTFQDLPVEKGSTGNSVRIDLSSVLKDGACPETLTIVVQNDAEVSSSLRLSAITFSPAL